MSSRIISYKCEICDYDSAGKYNSKSWKGRDIVKHIETIHNINYEEYITKYYYDGNRPKCKCGCNKHPRFYKGDFREYYKDHKNTVTGVYTEDNGNYAFKWGKNIERDLRRINITKDDLLESFKLYENKKLSLRKLSKKYGVDKRTLKKYWLKLNLCTKEQYRTLIKQHQFLWVIKKENIEKRKEHIDGNVLYQIYTYLKTNPQKYTLTEIKHKFDLESSNLVIHNRLKDNYDDIDDLINLGRSSNPEREFYNILKYYIQDDIKPQKRLKNKYYDYCILNKILIEFDGDYWHSLPKNKENDKFKNKLAKDNGYILIRIKESESKNIEHLNKIIELYEKIKIRCDN